jgi:hypothetical protein
MRTLDPILLLERLKFKSAKPVTDVLHSAEHYHSTFLFRIYEY